MLDVPPETTARPSSASTPANCVAEIPAATATSRGEAGLEMSYAFSGFSALISTTSKTSPLATRSSGLPGIVVTSSGFPGSDTSTT